MEVIVCGVATAPAASHAEEVHKLETDYVIVHRQHMVAEIVLR